VNRTRYGLSLAAAALVVAHSACSPSGSSKPAANSRPGTVGQSFLVTVYPPTGGTVTSADGQIACGSASGATRCGPASYPWGETVALTATPDAGMMFGMWAGDCSGRTLDANGKYTCFLGTGTSGADKYVLAVFDAAGKAMHGNFNVPTPVTKPTVHGNEFRNFIQYRNIGGDYFDCAYCHGANYAGVGIAPSCTQCHASNGHPNWLSECNFCHGSPPGPAANVGLAQNPPHDATHPATSSSDPKSCTGCHLKTVDVNGQLIPASAGGKHMDGNIDVTDPHIGVANYGSPAKHGPDFFAHLSGDVTALDCQGCHGSNFDSPIVTNATMSGGSCNSCHASNGWTGWTTNCSFCHGQKNVTTKAGYAVASFPLYSAPPDAIQQRLDGVAEPGRTGAHVLHLAGSAFARAFACSACHTVPTTLSHINNDRASVAPFAPGDSAPNPSGYDQTTQTCATACHGANLTSRTSPRSPAWTLTGMPCNGCHGVPPATPDGVHNGLSATDLTTCNGCHPTTVNPDGTINTSAAGTHINGHLDVITGHASNFALPTNHGPQLLNYVAGAPGSLNCKSCHGANLGYCDSCHSSSGNSTGTAWTSWQTNCTFCHGARTPAYNAATDLDSSAPPDDIAQRLTGVYTPSRTGQHTLHVFDGGIIPIDSGGVRCSGCHTVPGTIFDAGHVTADLVAGVSITPAGAFPSLSAGDLAKLPNPLVTYDRTNVSGPTCTGYCHGSTAWGGNNTTMIWTDDYSTPIQGCNDCHGQPPLTGSTVTTNATSLPGSIAGQNVCATGCSNHLFHSRIMAKPRYGFASCSSCHFGSANSNPYNGLHVNGKKDLVGSGTAIVPTGTATKPGGTSPVGNVTLNWNDTNRTCNSSCHIDTGTTIDRPW
jgi:hypothetical protein